MSDKTGKKKVVTVFKNTLTRLHIKRLSRGNTVKNENNKQFKLCKKHKRTVNCCGSCGMLDALVALT
jgi:hypothetical protein